MSSLAFLLVLVGSLQEILEFGSVTFLLVSLLMAIANFKIHRKTGAAQRSRTFEVDLYVVD